MKKLFEFDEYEDDLDWSGFVPPKEEPSKEKVPFDESYTETDFDTDVDKIRLHIIDLNNKKADKEEYETTANDLLTLARNCTECYMKYGHLDIKDCLRRCRTFYRIISSKF